MSLWDDIQPRLDPVSRLLPAADGGTDNLILYSAYLYRELVRLKEPQAATLYDRMQWFLGAVELEPGFYLRGPQRRREDGNSMDNMVGTAYVSFPDAQKILARWYTLGAYFNPADPSDELDRHIGLYGFFRKAALRPLTLVERLLWAAACLWSCWFDRGHTDRLLIQSLQVDVMGKDCPLACAVWGYFHKVPELLAAWFGETHPLAVWCNK